MVSVHSCEGSGKPIKTVPLPKIFNAPVRVDLVNFVHTQMRKNNRMLHGVSPKAGHQASAESWGTGRAVARIPRVHGGDTHRSGRGAFGNMCRGGHMLCVWTRASETGLAKESSEIGVKFSVRDPSLLSTRMREPVLPSVTFPALKWSMLISSISSKLHLAAILTDSSSGLREDSQSWAKYTEHTTKNQK